jgi:hypothetical protein
MENLKVWLVFSSYGYGDGTKVEAVYTSEESARAFMAQRNREYVDNLVGPGTFWVEQKEVQS